MPRMVGPVTADRWEREVRRQFSAQLPAAWIVVCNVTWCMSDRSGYVRDGQSDFVVLIPDHGMVIAEVKGSRKVRVDEDGNWYRTEYGSRGASSSVEVMVLEPPPEQASRNMYNLAHLIERELGLGKFPGAYTYLVIYPNGELTSASPLLDASTLICRKDMNDLAKRLRASLAARGFERVWNGFSASVCTHVARILSKQGFVVDAVDTELEAQDDNRSIDRLTKQQFAALRGAFELSRVAILGPAGSGKTMLAIWKLKALLEEGRRVIYVCFNKALAEFLARQEPDCAAQIWNVDKLFYDLVRPQYIQGDANHFFSEVLPERVLDAAVALRPEEKYDAIIVDEGQDFGASRTLALLELLRSPESQWVYFADWNQDVYRTNADSPLGAEVVFRLYHNCRNTELVNDASNRYCSMHVEPMPGSPIGERPLLEYRVSNESMAKRAWEIIHELQPAGGAVILSPFKLENSCMAHSLRGYGLVLTQDLIHLGVPGYVYFSTIRTFKGLEASLVVLVHAEMPNVHQSLSLEDLYVACTRAKSRLAIISGTESSYNWFSGLP